MRLTRMLRIVAEELERDKTTSPAKAFRILANRMEEAAEEEERMERDILEDAMLDRLYGSS